MGSKPHQDAVESEITYKDGCWTFKPGGFNIVWGKDGRYWHVPAEKGKPAELVQVCWLEVTCATTGNDVKPGKTYEISFEVSLKQSAFGWVNCPVFMMAKVGKRGKYSWKKIRLEDFQAEKQFTIPSEKFQITVPADCRNDDRKIYFGLYEVWTGKWKGGLQIYEAKVVEQQK